MPQLFGSVFVSVQPLAHAVCVLVHDDTHLLSLHTLPGMQTVPHLPQFWESTVRSTHLPLQSVQGDGGEPTHPASEAREITMRERTAQSVPVSPEGESSKSRPARA